VISYYIVFPTITYNQHQERTLMSKGKTKQEEALEFLDNLDNFTPDTQAPGSATAPGSTAPSGAKPGEAADVLAFIDEITQKSSEPTRMHIDRPSSRAGTPVPLRKSTERVKVGSSTLGHAGSSSSLRAQAAVANAVPSDPDSNPAAAAAATSESNSIGSAAGGGWSWGGVWSTASSALQQARTVVDEQVKNLPRQEQAMKWREGVMEYAKNAQLDKLGTLFIVLA
jgi:hypothetical protein